MTSSSSFFKKLKSSTYLIFNRLRNYKKSYKYNHIIIYKKGIVIFFLYFILLISSQYAFSQTFNIIAGGVVAKAIEENLNYAQNDNAKNTIQLMYKRTIIDNQFALVLKGHIKFNNKIYKLPVKNYKIARGVEVTQTVIKQYATKYVKSILNPYVKKIVNRNKPKTFPKVDNNKNSYQYSGAKKQTSIKYIQNINKNKKIEQVIVSGIGKDKDSALKRALLSAVEQVVGVYLSSDTIIKNRSLIKDEILNYSAGYVEDYKILSENKDEDGLWNVEIKANVVSTKLIRKMEELNLAVKNFNGGSLFGKAFTKIMEKKEAKKMLGKTLKKFPTAAYIISLGEPDIDSVDDASGKSVIKIPVTIEFDREWIGELEQSIEAVCKEKISGPVSRRKVNSNKLTRSILFTTTPLIRSGMPENIYVLEKSLYQFVCNYISGASDLNQHDDGIDTYIIYFNFKDKNGNLLEFNTVHIDRKYGVGDYHYKKITIPHINHLSSNSIFTFSSINDVGANLGIVNLSSYHWQEKRSSGIGFWKDIVMTFSVSLELNINTLKNIKTIETRISF